MSYRNTAFFIVVVATIVYPAPIFAQDDGCGYGEWHGPREFHELTFGDPGLVAREDGDEIMAVSAPTLVPMDFSVIILYRELTAMYVHAQRDLPNEGLVLNASTFIARDISGDTVFVRTMDLEAMSPRAVHLGEERWELIWSRTDSLQSYSSIGEPQRLLASTLWEGAWDEQRTLVYDEEGVEWGGYGSSSSFVVQGRRAWIVEGTWDRQHLAVLQADGKWQTSESSFSGVYPHLMEGPNGRLFLFFIGSAMSHVEGLTSDGNSVLVATSNDGGETWGEPSVLHVASEQVHGTRRDAKGTHALFDAAGRLHAFWGVDTDEDSFSDVVHHVLSDDGGASWSTPQRVTPAGSGGVIGGIRAVVGFDDKVHVIMRKAEGWGSPNAEIYYIVGDGEQWAPPEILFPATPSLPGAPRLEVDERGHLHVLAQLMHLDHERKQGTLALTYISRPFRSCP